MNRFRLFVFSALLLLLSLTCGAASGEYIVYLRSNTPDLLTKSDGMPAFSVVDADTLADLQAKDAVLWYEEDAVVHLLGTVGYSDTHYALKWDLTMIDAQSAWNNGYKGAGVTIGVIDSGVQSDHPDLAGRLLPTVCYLKNGDADTDTIGHGTFVTGMIAAGINGIGSIGVAPEATVKPLKCFDADVETTISMIIPAIYDAVDIYGCRILNMSLGVQTDSQTLKAAIDYALENGCVVVAAAGNDGNAVLNYPAAYAGVIGVGAVNPSKKVASFSQRNESVMIVAPGEQVVSTLPNSQYGRGDGTSFATPLVSGAAALLLAAEPDLTVTEMLDLLTRTAVPLGTAEYSTNYGYGLLHIGRALRALNGISGDLDRDGDPTVKDALLLLHAMLNASTTVDMSIADVDGDGMLTLKDVVLLLYTAA